MHRDARVRPPLGAIFALTLGLVVPAVAVQPGPPEAAASGECKVDEARTYDATITWSAPEGTALAALAVVVSYPKTVLVVPGTGSSLATDTRVEGPKDGMLAVSDQDGELTVLAANPKGIPAGRVARVRFRGCAGAAPPPKDALGCTVRDASDDSSNPPQTVTCTATLP